MFNLQAAHHRYDVLIELSRIWGVKHDGFVRDFLNWVEVREMMDSGLISFVSHTLNLQVPKNAHCFGGGKVA